MFTIKNTRIRMLFILAALSGLVTATAATELRQSFPIQGTVPDMRQATSASGVSLQVHFQQIEYAGTVSGVTIEKMDGHYDVEMALQGAVLRIGRTSIQGGFRMGAETGPMSIRLGTRNDLRVKYDVAIDNGKVRVLNTAFQLASDNWEIDPPTFVRTSGFGVTQQRVVNGLQQGLRNNRAAIERILVEESQQMLAPLEPSILAYANSESTTVDELPAPIAGATTPSGEANSADLVAASHSETTGVDEQGQFVPKGRVALDSDEQGRPANPQSLQGDARGPQVVVSQQADNLIYCPPPTRFGYRMRSFFRGTLGALGMAR